MRVYTPGLVVRWLRAWRTATSTENCDRCLSGFATPLNAHQLACLQVLDRAVLDTRNALLNGVRNGLPTAVCIELLELMDAVHNLPAAIGGNHFWSVDRVRSRIAAYDKGRKKRALCQATLLRYFHSPHALASLATRYDAARAAPLAASTKLSQLSAADSAGGAPG
jgi:hypothetical protein